jgi:hypothetical protein
LSSTIPARTSIIIARSFSRVDVCFISKSLIEPLIS